MTSRVADVFKTVSAEAFKKAPYLRNPPLRRVNDFVNRHATGTPLSELAKARKFVANCSTTVTPTTLRPF